MNAIVRRDKTKLELAQYLYACAFSPALSINATLQLIYSAHPESTQIYQLIVTSTAIVTLMHTIWHHQAQKLFYTKNQITEARGNIMVWRPGMLGLA